MPRPLPTGGPGAEAPVGLERSGAPGAGELFGRGAAPGRRPRESSRRVESRRWSLFGGWFKGGNPRQRTTWEEVGTPENKLELVWPGRLATRT